MPIDDQIVQIASILKIQPQWLADPYLFVINMAIPFGLNALAFYFILRRVVIKNSALPAALLASVLAFLAMPIGSIVIYFSPLIIVLLGIQRWPNRIIILDVFYTLVLLILPAASKMTFPPLTTIALWLVPAMFGVVASMQTWKSRIIFLAIVIGIWWFLLPFIQSIH
jgi:hypothetical protein